MLRSEPTTPLALAALVAEIGATLAARQDLAAPDRDQEHASSSAGGGTRPCADLTALDRRLESLLARLVELAPPAGSVPEVPGALKDETAPPGDFDRFLDGRASEPGAY